MKMLLHKKIFSETFTGELLAISGFYGLEDKKILETVLPLAPYFENYWEMVFSETDLEVITAGTGTVFSEKILDLAGRAGLSVKTQLFYEACRIAFPEAIAGIKLCFSKKKNELPTLYLRTKIDLHEAFDFLKEHLGTGELQRLKNALKDNSILYGLGFSEKNGSLYLKTYTIGHLVAESGELTKGFVSYRLHQGELLEEHKTYLPDVSLTSYKPTHADQEKLLDFLANTMNYTQAGHVGLLHENGKVISQKIYVERIGGIPTDFSAE